MLRALVLGFACGLVATPAAAQCGDRLQPRDRAELAPRTLHGIEYLEHPTLGFRILAPDLPRVQGGASSTSVDATSVPSRRGATSRVG